MINTFRSSTKSLTGRLALFFALLSTVVGGVSYTIFYSAIHWSEDRFGERRIILDRNEAISRYQAGEDGVITIDILTEAYNDWDLIPKEYLPFFQDKTFFIGEVGDDPHSRMVYVGNFSKNGTQFPIILLSEIDKVELQLDEIIFSVSVVMGLVTTLMLLFGALLYRLSKRLIEPINSLSKQLETNKGKVDQAFSINNAAAVEFKLLADQMNHYRHEINSLLKREQAFARYASHELRTPLTVVRGSNKLLSRGDNNEFQTRQIKRIDDAAYQMSTMVDALLGLVRYERDHDSEPMREFSESELKSILDQNSEQAVLKQVNVECTIETSPQVQATTAVMNMIIGNLVRNAIAATNQGVVEVRMTSEYINIKDQGEGLTEKPSADGHGLGLLIVDDLCSRYGWSFSLSNHKSGGCEAVVTFPSLQKSIPLADS
ncbi:HAMP domain-containing histidine kinase [Vibrio genomosp. F6]|uniref:sensor histidine kinase n=1 Tax=Vibrio genomosp. F6 TaxID=723172 RepID=UPI0010BDAC18|nr:HAMP domain-containing sensor histidine kinase [Vibrio genomosp. F6]TKF24138.1 HAMP domain-containing histidine kinase [Vibrio genomosp. F6]